MAGMATVICRYCGTENRADATFCNNCGGALKPIPAPSRPAPAPAPAASPASAHPTPSNATGRLSPQSLLAGHYLILKNAGQGGMAAVYQATDLKTRATVAIKEMSQDGLSAAELDEALASFASEAKMLRELRHPNLPRVYETLAEHARQYLVMDFIEGRTLEQRQQAAGGGPLPQTEVLEWARQLCSVLSYLHTRRPPIIFRDLKPANIMVTPQGQIKLIDFGIARAFAPGRAHDTQVLGTPGFAPPEQYGKAQTDNRADIYALGCTLYQLLTGYDPALTPFNLPPMRSRNPAIPASVQSAIERATKLDRDARYPTVDDFARGLLAGTSTGAQFQSVPKTTIPHTAVKPPASAQNWINTFNKVASAASAVAAAANAAATGAMNKGGNGSNGAHSATHQPAHAAARAAPTAPSMAAIVVVQPHTVDFGHLVLGQRGSLAITISGQNRVPVRGQIQALAPWLRVDRSRFDGPSTLVQLSAETSAIGKPGKQQSTLQIICDNQQLYVPVTVDVVPALSGQQARPAPAPRQKPAKPAKTASPAKGSQAQAAPNSARVARAAAKYAPRIRQGGGERWGRLASSMVLALIVAAGVLAAGQQLIGHALAVPMSAPIAMALLLLAALASGLGAVVGAGGRSWRGRITTALLGALIGGALVVFTAGPWFWSGFVGLSSLSTLLTHPVTIPQAVLLLAPVASATGGAIGADPFHSRWMLNVAGFVRRHAPIFITTGAILGGAYLGFALTHALLFGFLTPFGIAGGILLGLALARTANRLLRRGGRPPRAQPYGPYRAWP